MSDKKTINETVKNNLKRLRNANDLKQEEVANALCLKDSSVYRSWETGRACPKLNMIVKIANMYKVSADEILLTEEELKEKTSISTDTVSKVANPNQYNSEVYGDSHMGELDNFDKVILMKIHQLNKKDKDALADYIDKLVP